MRDGKLNHTWLVVVDRFLVRRICILFGNGMVFSLLSCEACAQPNSIHIRSAPTLSRTRSSLTSEAGFFAGIITAHRQALILSVHVTLRCCVVVAGDLFRDRSLPRGRGVPRLARSPPTPLLGRRRRRFGRTSQIQVSYYMYRAGYRQCSATRGGKEHVPNVRTYVAYVC